MLYDMFSLLKTLTVVQKILRLRGLEDFWEWYLYLMKTLWTKTENEVIFWQFLLQRNMKILLLLIHFSLEFIL